MSNPITFNNQYYSLSNDDWFVPKVANARLTIDQQEEVIKDIAHYVEARIISQYGFVSIPVPGEDISPNTTILASHDWQTANKLLIIVQNSPGSMLGIFSRSLCLDEGLSKGSMLPYIERALSAEYGVIILRPNTNTAHVLVDGEDKKVPITGSETPEIHALCVWENVVNKAASSYVALLGYGNATCLMKELYLHALVRSANGKFKNRIKAFITIETFCHILEDDDDPDVRKKLGKIAVNLESSKCPKGSSLEFREEKMGCKCVSLGLPSGVDEPSSIAISIPLALSAVFTYLQVAEAEGNVSQIFCDEIAKENNLSPSDAEVKVNPMDRATSPSKLQQSSSPVPPKPTFFESLMGGNKSKSKSPEIVEQQNNKTQEIHTKLCVNDFDFLKIVGKGAFGKVLLVRKKNGVNAGQIYAMKVLKKSTIIEQNQVDNVKSEQDILFKINHPFIVRLRFSFQNEEKLYLVTDYYNGGTLFVHLREAGRFPEERARFYAAELLLALDHLHSLHIIYRDLKLENVLLDHHGHVALTDFGLSKQDIDKTGGARTLCGTPDYVAPELLKGWKYGKAVDWWSFGVLLYEMLNGETPFYDENRDLMFKRILASDVVIPEIFSQEAADCVKGILKNNANIRLGVKGKGVADLKACSFFAPINFEKLERKEITPVFKPDVVNEVDTKYVPNFYKETNITNDSISVSTKSKSTSDDANLKIEGFTYQGDSGLR